jgi:hypothetical protein
MLPNHRWVTGRHSLMTTGPTRHAVPCGHAGLAFGPSTTLWADFRVVLACKARRHLRAEQVHNLVHIKQLKKFISKLIFSNLNQHSLKNLSIQSYFSFNLSTINIYSHMILPFNQLSFTNHIELSLLPFCQAIGHTHSHTDHRRHRI